MPKNKSWFRMEKKDDGTVDIEIFDDIDSFWGIGPKEFKTKLDEVKDASSIRLLLNSGGGSVFDGWAIYNILGEVREKLTVEVIGLAASIASIIALAGSKLIMARGSYFMIHNPWTMIAGDANDLRKTAELMDRMKTDLAGVYAEKSGESLEDIAVMMDEETWLSAEDAEELGFADETSDYGQVAAKVTDQAKKSFKHIPGALALTGAKDKPEIATERQLESFLRDAGGFSRSDAEAIVSRGWKAIARGDPGRENQGDPGEKPVSALAISVREKEIEFEIRRMK